MPHASILRMQICDNCKLTIYEFRKSDLRNEKKDF